MHQVQRTLSEEEVKNLLDAHSLLSGLAAGHSCSCNCPLCEAMALTYHDLGPIVINYEVED